MKYFAYGEKMFSPNLLKIAPGAVYSGAAKLMGYKLCFHSRGQNDFSGKCNIVPVKDPASEVYGVLYSLTSEEKCLLDKEQSLGWGNEAINLRVFPLNRLSAEGEFVFTYVAHKDNIFEDLVPFTWYKETIIEGAKEHHLPENYIYSLQQIASMQDPNIQRATKERRYLEALCTQ